MRVGVSRPLVATIRAPVATRMVARMASLQFIKVCLPLALAPLSLALSRKIPLRNCPLSSLFR